MKRADKNYNTKVHFLGLISSWWKVMRQLKKKKAANINSMLLLSALQTAMKAVAILSHKSLSVTPKK